MSALAALRIHRLFDGDRLRVKCDLGPEFPEGGGVDALFSRLPVSNNASRNVPSGSIGFILPPGEQRAAVVVLNQQVDVDERREAAEEEEEFLRQSAGGLAYPSIQHCKSLLMILFDHAGYDDT